MSPLALRPRVRIPLKAAVTIVAAAYVFRSALRGFDFRPDLPFDALVLLALVLLAGARYALTRPSRADGTEDERGREVDEKDADAGGQG